MSLILEALKKSEAERRLGQAPDLLTPARHSTANPPSREWRGVVMGALSALLIVGGLWGWNHWQTVPNAAEPVAQPVVTEALPAPARPSEKAAPIAAPAPASVLRSEADTIANVPVPQDPDFRGTERESQAMPANAIPLSVPASAPALPPKPVPQPAPVTSVPETPAPTGVTSAPAPAPSAVLEALPSLALLLPHEREGLPPLRVSMHVYDANPAARVVLIDGKRYREGATIVEGVAVQQIRPDGVAVSVHDRTFLLPRP